MRNYLNLIKHTFDFDSPDFVVDNLELHYHGVPIIPLIKQFGTPLRLTVLPRVSENIQKAKKLFTDAIQKHNYGGSYTYCYCTKSSHFSFILEEVLKNETHIETSSTFDIDIVKSAYQKGWIDKKIYVLNNGFKRVEYCKGISELINGGFENCIPILDNMEEMKYYEKAVDKPFQLGVRLSTDEEPGVDFYTSRLGLRYKDVVPFYKDRIENNPKVSLKLLHFFNNSGIKDTVYFWSELDRFVHKYCQLRKICPTLDILDIGGGFPIKQSLAFSYDYEYMTEEIILTIKNVCEKYDVPVPSIFTEFGSFTVGESGAMFYSVLEQKKQNDKELWYIIDGSLITQLPDTWGMNQKFIMLPINNWGNEFNQVLLGGITCDSMDYYNSESHASKLTMPKFKKGTKQYIGFFNIGAYQESLGGYGGIQHCLVPAPKHVIVDRDASGNLRSRLFRDEQTSNAMLKLLGYYG
ncbi:MAG: arginine decarboxylase [Cytophagales bacterium]|nr:MAG: arginine decarboxylase [Cytophagales bacterium]TAF61021.1 MAG: arginine decarboxylase [Cytophagales bacterium]